MLTQRQIDRAAYDPDKGSFQALQERGGLTFRLSSIGNHTWAWRFSIGGKTRYLTFGRHPEMSLEQARVAIVQYRKDRAFGIDPSNPFSDAVTIKTLAKKLLKEHIPDLRPNSQRVFKKHLLDDIIPAWGKRIAMNLTPEDVRTLHRSLRDTPSYANRMLTTINLLYNKAREWGYEIPIESPSRRVKRYPTNPRRRFLSDDELKRVFDVLNDWPDQNVANLFKLLIYTGARRNEIARLEWEWVSADFGYIDYPPLARKTGAMRLWLSEEATAILDQQWQFSGTKSPYVFPSDRNVEKARPRVWEVWQKIIRQAYVKNVRIHDLRHTFATVGVGVGGNLPLIGGLLGHKSTAMTELYAHIDQKPLRELTAQIGEHLRRLEVEA